MPPFGLPLGLGGRLLPSSSRVGVIGPGTAVGRSCCVPGRSQWWGQGARRPFVRGYPSGGSRHHVCRGNIYARTRYYPAVCLASVYMLLVSVSYSPSLPRPPGRYVCFVLWGDAGCSTHGRRSPTEGTHCARARVRGRGWTARVVVEYRENNKTLKSTRGLRDWLCESCTAECHRSVKR